MKKMNNIKKNEKAHLLDVLQAEYIYALIRLKTYPRKRDKNFFKLLLLKKRDKIENISKRNRIETIISSKNKMDELWMDIVPEWGYPKFNYDNKYDLPSYIGSTIKGTPFIGTTGIVNYNECISRPMIIDSVSDCHEFVYVKNTPKIVDFSKESPDHFKVPKKHVRPMTPQECDFYFYYYRGSHFLVNNIEGVSSLNAANSNISFENSVQGVSFSLDDNAVSNYYFEKEMLDKLKRIL